MDAKTKAYGLNNHRWNKFLYKMVDNKRAIKARKIKRETAMKRSLWTK